MNKGLFINLIVLSAGFLFSMEAHACIGSDCKPCPDGFSITEKCCKTSDGKDCVFLKAEIEDCGLGQWQDYPLSVSFHSFSRMDCCKDATENNCRSIPHTNDFCGEGEFEAYPYSPVKKCCKDSTQNDCVTIRSKGRCGVYQLKDYPLQVNKCCDSTNSECVEITDCPKCM